MKQKLLSLCLLVTVLTASLPALAAETVAFEDDAGRVVDVPADISRIAPAGQMAQIMLLAIAPERLVGIASPWTDAAKQYLGDAYALPVIGQLYGSRDLNLEELATLDPQIIIDIGEVKDSIVQDMDDLQEQVGIPTVHVDAYLDTFGDCFRTLGALLGLQDRGELLGAYCDAVYAQTQALMDEVGENRVDLLYLLGEDGLSVIARDSYHGELLAMMADNVAVVEDPSSKGTGNQVDMEQLLLWNPSTIVFAPGSAYAAASEDALWQEMDAVANGRYVEVPMGPYNWIGFPPSVQRYLGMLWLPSVLYPDYVDYDLYEQVAEYFSLFYHHDLTEAEFEALTENARF